MLGFAAVQEEALGGALMDVETLNMSQEREKCEQEEKEQNRLFSGDRHGPLLKWKYKGSGP